MSICLYGDFGKQHSTGRVSEGFKQVLSSAHLYDLGEWQNDLDESLCGKPGASAKHGIFVGNLSQVDVLFRGNHEKTYAMVAPNSDTIGPVLKRTLVGVDTLLVPSLWAGFIVSRTFPGKNIRVVPHGVDPGFSRHAPANPKGYSVLHLSSTQFQRKGTDKLIQGWSMAMLPGEARLFISVPKGMVFHYQELATEVGARNVHVTDRLDNSVANMARLYSAVDAVCQPSRGEGFGMVPLEARCCGTPAIMTLETGHGDHADGPGVVPIASGPPAPIDDFPGANAPSVSASAVADALVKAYRDRERLSAEAIEHAAALKKQWSWENQLEEFKNDVS